MLLADRVFSTPLVLAPMAGVSDSVFRRICLARGASYAPGEMTSARPVLRASEQTQRRLQPSSAQALHIVQIAGADPQEMADAARDAVALGAQVVDINMGCPAKRVCNRLAGSALLRDEALVQAILRAVVAAVAVPVTLKTRTGWSRTHRNAVTIARIAEDAGIQLLTLHGRTRECAYGGEAEYDTIAEVKASVGIPVVANGDITTPAKARAVLAHTGADGLMVGRAAQGDPWIFQRIRHFLDTGRELPPPPPREVLLTLREHVAGLHQLHGAVPGARMARKHAGWYSRHLADGPLLRQRFNALEQPQAQLDLLDQLLAREAPEPKRNAA